MVSSRVKQMELSVINNDDTNNENEHRQSRKHGRRKSSKKVIGCNCRPRFVIWFSNLFIVRILTAVFTFQAAIMWLAFSLNYIFQLFFLPFDNSRLSSFIVAAFMIPGIVFFSMHYFWFVIETAVSFAYKTVETDNTSTTTNSVTTILKKPYPLLFWISSQVHPELREWFRLLIFLCIFPYVIFYGINDRNFVNAFIVPTGQVPLALMWFLHIIHVISVWVFLFDELKTDGCFRSSQTSVENGSNGSSFRDAEQNETLSDWTWKGISFYLTFGMVIPMLLQLYGTLIRFGQIAWVFVWIICLVYWLIRLFLLRLKCCACCKILQENDTENSGCCCLCMRNRCDISETNELRQFAFFKNFIVFFIMIIATLLAFIYQHDKEMNSAAKIFFIVVIGVLWLCELVLLIPSSLRSESKFKWIHHWQILLIDVLKMLSSCTVLIAFIIVVADYRPKFVTVVACLILPFFYHLPPCVYFASCTIARCRGRRSDSGGINRWLTAHTQVSRFPKLLPSILLVLTIIGVAGLIIAAHTYYDPTDSVDMINPDTLSSPNELFNGSIHLDSNELYSGRPHTTRNDVPNDTAMKICNWQMADLNIQDMILFASLAYRPIDEVEQELHAYYNRTNLQFTLDRSLSQSSKNGYGNASYYTLFTDNVVIVTIRGTSFSYDALIDGDIWIESIIYQIISILFPWSMLFPEYLTSRIIRHTSIFERIVDNGQQHRFYVRQMIKALKKVDERYGRTHAFFIVGHSLGGGLAKLAGIALNSTAALVSISGPGITYSHAKVDETLNITMESVNRRTINIYNSRDVVPWVDKQEGLIQLITCPSHLNFLQCHDIKYTLCNVMNICGNPKGLDIGRVCKRS